MCLGLLALPSATQSLQCSCDSKVTLERCEEMGARACGQVQRYAICPVFARAEGPFSVVLRRMNPEGCKGLAKGVRAEERDEKERPEAP